MEFTGYGASARLEGLVLHVTSHNSLGAGSASEFRERGEANTQAAKADDPRD